MIVYLCGVMEVDDLRQAVREATLERWLYEEGDWLEVRLLFAPARDCSFQRARRVIPNEQGGAFYVVADDDCFLHHETDIHRCRQILEKHPDYAILSLWPDNVTMGEYPHGDEDVIEIPSSVGGIRFCRHIPGFEFPPMGDGPGYDAIHCQALRDAGYNVAANYGGNEEAAAKFTQATGIPAFNPPAEVAATTKED